MYVTVRYAAIMSGRFLVKCMKRISGLFHFMGQKRCIYKDIVATELALHEAQTLFEQEIDLLLAGLASTDRI